jgi:hypothetical protein
MTPDVTPISIPTPLFQRIESSLGTLGYPSVEAFVIHAIRAVLSTYETGSAPTEAEEAQIVERLRRLGYID